VNRSSQYTNDIRETRMGKLPNITRLISEDVPAEQREWFDKILKSLNEFISTTLSLFKKGLNFQDNMDAMIHTAEFSGRDFSESTVEPISIRSTLRGQPIGVLKIQLTDVTPDGSSTLGDVPYDIQWRYDQEGKVNITNITNIDANNSTSDYRMTLLIF